MSSINLSFLRLPLQSYQPALMCPPVLQLMSYIWFSLNLSLRWFLKDAGETCSCLDLIFHLQWFRFVWSSIYSHFYDDIKILCLKQYVVLLNTMKDISTCATRRRFSCVKFWNITLGVYCQEAGLDKQSLSARYLHVPSISSLIKLSARVSMWCHHKWNRTWIRFMKPKSQKA